MTKVENFFDKENIVGQVCVVCALMAHRPCWEPRVDSKRS